MAAKNSVDSVQFPEGKGNCVLCAAVAERICQRCGDFYCSKDCQLKDWPRHRYICFPLPALVHPKSYSVLLSVEELSLEGACAVSADKCVVGAAPAPVPIIVPDIMNHNIGSNISSTSNIAPKNSVPAPIPTPLLPIPNIVSSNSGNKAKNKITSPPNAIMPPSNSLVYITGFRSANRCNIRDASEAADKAFAQVCEKINAMGNEMPKMVKPRSGFCLARHNGMFQRAKMINPLASHYARLLFIDHGVTKSRTVSDMREINDELLSLPCLSLPVQLKDVANFTITDDVIAFVSQFEGEMFVAVHKKTPGCIYVELLDPVSKMSLNDKIREFCSNKEVFENPFNKKKDVPNQQNSQKTPESNKLKQSIPYPSISGSQTTTIMPQQSVKKIEADVKNQSESVIDFQESLKKLEPENMNLEEINLTNVEKCIKSSQTNVNFEVCKTDFQRAEKDSQESLKKLEAEAMKEKFLTTDQESIKSYQTKINSDVLKNDPSKTECQTAEMESQESLKGLEAKDKNQEVIIPTGDDNVKINDPSELFSKFFRTYVNANDIHEQDEKKLSPREIFAEFLRSHAKSKDVKDSQISNFSQELNPQKEKVGKPNEITNIIIEDPIKSNQVENEEIANFKSNLGSKDNEMPKEDDKQTVAKQEIQTAPKTFSKSRDEEVKDFLTQCLASKNTLLSDNATPLKFPKLKEKLDLLSISKKSSQENGMVMPKNQPLVPPFDLVSISKKSCEENGMVMPKNQPLLNPPFELRHFSIESKDGIDVFVVDNSKISRGILGAFDSSYAYEFSTLHSRLSEITNSEPYKPVAKEYVLARFEGSWYRGRVEQIITTKSQTEYRVQYIDYTNVEDITEQDIRRYPLNFTTPCNTNLCVIQDFPHKPNPAQISYLSEVLKVHQLVHVDDVNYLNNIAMITSRSLINKLMTL
ncbi:uncharacterized protein LOC108042758 [Drosophila rhopaloa]|uniref:Uncharacterized protein LOC108042758 n=1 Tax=Drosophila rhopaloa TaxID=1041015 RepID=A0A6P4EEQ6_DRORH|nr:uncharacterized protein LOC108042758 [Drosophila rhopaloa]